MLRNPWPEVLMPEYTDLDWGIKPQSVTPRRMRVCVKDRRNGDYLDCQCFDAAGPVEFKEKSNQFLKEFQESI